MARSTSVFRRSDTNAIGDGLDFAMLKATWTLRHARLFWEATDSDKAKTEDSKDCNRSGTPGSRSLTMVAMRASCLFATAWRGRNVSGFDRPQSSWLRCSLRLSVSGRSSDRWVRLYLVRQDLEHCGFHGRRAGAGADKDTAGAASAGAVRLSTGAGVGVAYPIYAGAIYCWCCLDCTIAGTMHGTAGVGDVLPRQVLALRTQLAQAEVPSTTGASTAAPAAAMWSTIRAGAVQPRCSAP